MPPDDEPPPPGDEDVPPGFAEPPARVFPPEPSPGGCAEGACAAGDDRSAPQEVRWASFLASIRQTHPVLHPLLAEGKLAWIRPGEVALGFSSQHAFHKAQLGSEEMRRTAEQLLGAWFGAPTRLRLDVEVGAEGLSVAEAERRRREQEAAERRRRAREHEAVRAVQTLLGGEIVGIEVPEDR